MSVDFRLKRTNTGTVPASLADGEIRIDQKNGLLYWRTDTGTVMASPLKVAVANGLLKLDANGKASLANLPSLVGDNGIVAGTAGVAPAPALGDAAANKFFFADGTWKALGTAALKDTGTTANKVVALDSAGKLPAVDGSQLTNLPSSGGGGAVLVQASVVFRWNGSAVVIDKAINVTSVVRNGVGDYTITFTTALPSALYGVLGSPSGPNITPSINVHAASMGAAPTLKTTTQCRVIASYYTNVFDPSGYAHVAFMGG